MRAAHLDRLGPSVVKVKRDADGRPVIDPIRVAAGLVAGLRAEGLSSEQIAEVRRAMPGSARTVRRRFPCTRPSSSPAGEVA